MVLLSGTAAWCRQQAARLIAQQPDPFWFGDTPPAALRAANGSDARRQLGGELATLVIDSHSGFDVDAVAAVAGALCAGGVLLLLTPPLTQWHRFRDPEHARIAIYPAGIDGVSGRFLARLAAVVARQPALLQIREPLIVPTLPPLDSPALAVTPADWVSGDQSATIAALERVVSGHRRRPLVIVADRGRGKSAALGIAAARLLRGGHSPILLTAPRLDAVGRLLHHAAQQLPQATLRRDRIDWQGGTIRFLAPDRLLAEAPAAALLLVDEAAALPTPQLEQLLRRYGRIAFATTIHGYEGNGRGFAVRFRATLDRLTPQWREVTLTEPIRWGVDDPLEQLLYEALLLDAAAADDAAVALPTATHERSLSGADVVPLERIDRDQLVSDEPLLRQLFGLLVSAHYRTRPLDLRHLLDGANLTIWLQRTPGGAVVAVLLTATEGGLDGATSEAIYRGETRPHGHLLPEVLSIHLGVRQAPQLRALRILRLAVHPARQRQQIGTQLLRQLYHHAATDGFDYLGSSFGATPDLLQFWQRNGWQPCRVSIAQGNSSGSHSLLLLQPVSDRGQRLCSAAQQRFRRHFPALLGDALRDLDAALALPLLATLPPSTAALIQQFDEADWADAISFAYGERHYEMVVGVLQPLALVAVSDPVIQRTLTAPQLQLLLWRVIQQQPWPQVVAQSGANGRAAALAALRATYRQLLLGIAPAAHLNHPS